MAKFKAGDLVYLGSGGPRKTVVEITGTAASNYNCQWFDQSELKVANFLETSLVPASDFDNPPAMYSSNDYDPLA